MQYPHTELSADVSFFYLIDAGAPGWNRTSDPQLRRLMLYPTELRARIGKTSICGFATRHQGVRCYYDVSVIRREPKDLQVSTALYRRCNAYRLVSDVLGKSEASTPAPSLLACLCTGRHAGCLAVAPATAPGTRGTLHRRDARMDARLE